MPRAKQAPVTLTSYTPIRAAFIAGEITEAEVLKQMASYQKAQKAQKARRSRIDPAFTDDDVRNLITHWKRLRKVAA